MDVFTRLFGDLLVFVYHCFDRIVINGYLGWPPELRQTVKTLFAVRWKTIDRQDDFSAK